MDLKLSAQKREKNEQLDKDYLAAVVYGHGLESQSLKLKKNEFDKIYSLGGESNLIKLTLGGDTFNVLIKDTQRDVLKNTFIHVDFYQVNMKETVNAEIPLHFIGESKAVKELGGSLIKEVNEVKVECLPGDLVDHIDVDISVINNFEDVIRVSDIIVPKGMEMLLDLEAIVAMVVEPKVQEEEVVAVASDVPADKAKEAPADSAGSKK